MFSNNDRFYGLNMIELADSVFLMQLHDHHAKMVMAYKALLLDKSSNSFYKILNKVSDLRCEETIK